MLLWVRARVLVLPVGVGGDGTHIGEVGDLRGFWWPLWPLGLLSGVMSHGS